jgi:hypothetical protein
MANAYKTFDEEGLDAALTTIEPMAPAKVESSGEETTPSDPTKQRRRLSCKCAGD